MGVGQSREIEEQLEAALSLLDAARAKQEQLKAECDNLHARIAEQSVTLLQGEADRGRVHLVQEPAPLSKRVLFGLVVTTPLALHTLLSALAIEIVDLAALAQAVMLMSTVVVLLRLRRYRWRRISPDRITFTKSPNDDRSAAPAHRPSSASVDGGGGTARNKSALLASEAELAVLREVKENLRREPPAEDRGRSLIPTHEPMLDVQV